MMALKKFVVGNWKMHGLSSDLAEIRAIASASLQYPEVDVALCVPAILIERAVREVPAFLVGGQDVHQEPRGAHTGCTSAGMLVDAGARLTIVGHSERREAQRESNDEIRAKAEAALTSGLAVIVCVGEPAEERERGTADDFVTDQLRNSVPRGADGQGELVIAYEPIWAIGSGKIPTLEEIGATHEAIRTTLLDLYGPAGDRVRLLYGGSVKPSNAQQIFAIPNVDGALVGGASLKSADFLPIVAAAAAAA